MKTSVIMSTLAEPGWDRNLRSVFDQSDPPDEVIVVVDRVTSGADRRLFEETHRSVRYVFNDENIGLTRSLNRGIEASRGDILFRIDDDDICHRLRFGAQRRALEDAEADLVCSFALGQKLNDTRTWAIEHARDDRRLKLELSRRNVIVHSTLGFTRAAIERLGGYDTHFRYAQDYALYLKAIRLGMKFAIVSSPLVTRTYAPGAITLRHRKQQIMYSSAARMLHAAELGDVQDFRRSMRRSAVRLSTPNLFRHWRRAAFGLVGRGA